MTGLYTDYVSGDTLERLIQRSRNLKAELRARGEAIENGDPEELAKLRRGVSEHIRGVPGNRLHYSFRWWYRLMGKHFRRLRQHPARKIGQADSH